MTVPDDPHTPASDPTAHRAAVWPWLVLALVVIVLDQISKYQIIASFAYGERLPVIAGFFDLTLLYNPGAAFSFLAGHSGWQRWFFAGIAVVASAVLISLFYQGGWAFPAFNLADCAITLGAILLICHELLPWLRPRKAR